MQLLIDSQTCATQAANYMWERRGPVFCLDRDIFAKNLWCSRRGAAGGPSGMTSEHLRPLLDSPEDTDRFWRMAQDLACVEVPPEVVDLIRLGRLTVLQKPTGGVRGIVAGDIIRRLVARTITQQLAPAVTQATQPFQYVLTTRAGGECIAHALQAITDLDATVTIMSVDGIGACDLISRRAMLEGLRSVSGGESVLPFVMQFYGCSSSYLWDDDGGITREIRQGEGGEQGDPMMPMLYSLGQHQALAAVQTRLRPGEHLLAFLDDTYVISQTERSCELHAILRAALWNHSRIQLHAGKLQMWNRAGIVPRGHDALLSAAQTDDPNSSNLVWRPRCSCCRKWHQIPGHSVGRRGPLSKRSCNGQLRSTDDS